METTPEVERHADDTSTAAAQEEHVECSNKTEIEAVTNEGAIVVRSGPEQPAQQPMNSTGKGIFAPMEIREINLATHVLPKIDPASKGKEILDVFAKPIPVEEHCMLVLKSAWEDVSSRTSDFDKWVHFRTERRTLVQYKMYEMEIQKRVDEHHAKFYPDESSVNYDYMCIRFLSRELIVKQHRAL
ncbi:hypothetical protein F511_44701 [Dorcoceras hygrometricum]|uniref:Uncharacterized protein n=1 Tax=Dorcoceras hygrometricum TaxID=472368 RepID=A0A2Z7CVY9_9LAMI|nr:hypothetical protein F511_44701 [Dorcoceras hygrometricum]